MDITSVQQLIDVRNQLDRWAAPDTVDWHFACINNRWTKRALNSAGFGYPSPKGDAPLYERWKPVFSVAEIGGQSSAAAAAEFRENEKELKRQRTADVEEARSRSVGGDANNKDITSVGQHDAASSSSGSEYVQQLGSSKAYNKVATARVAIVQGLSKPLFHVDLTSALQSAIANVEMRGEGGVAKGVGTEAI